MYTFGNWISRLARGGVSLSPAEQWLLQQLVGNLPPHLKPVAERQIASYNLAQREWDKRAINLYRMPSMEEGTPLLQMPPQVDWPLIRITASAGTSPAPVHATLTAVAGRVFCMSFNRPVKRLSASSLRLLKVKHAWRSNFPPCATDSSFELRQ
jgi:hypothetical protein